MKTTLKVKVARGLGKVAHTLKKHSPLLFAGGALIGMGATAVMAYRCRPAVEDIVEGIETAREHGEEIDRLQVVKEMAVAVGPTVAVGVASAGMLVLSHRIQNKRLVTLSSVLASSQAANKMLEERFRKKFGEQAYKEIMTTDKKKVVDQNGEDVMGSEEDIRADYDSTYGEWFDKSEFYCSDDHEQNLATIRAMIDDLQARLFTKGAMLQNEVREKLGFAERPRSGALLGWTTADSFDIELIVSNFINKDTGEIEPQIFLKWSMPRYIYGEMEFDRSDDRW